MKRIINIILITTILGGMLFIFSCDDEFLKEEPPGSAAGSVMQDEKGVESLLVGAYDMITGNWIFGACMGTDWTWGSCASDDAYKGTTEGDQTPFNDVELYQTLPTNPYMVDRWGDCYNGVSRTNDVLDFLRATQEGDNPIPEVRAKEIEAEAKFLRAWYHFKATRIFENIPYIKTEEELGMKPDEVPNDDPGWDDIEADLKFAIDNLPEDPPKGEVGRADKWAALAVKAHVHLYQNELSDAKPLLDNIINNGPFELAPEYYHNYNEENENNMESIFEIQVSMSAEDRAWWGVAANNLGLHGAVFHQRGEAGVGWGFYQPSQNLFEAFQTTEDGLPVLDVEDRDELKSDMGVASGDEFIPTDHPLDPRVDYTIARRGIDFLGWGIHRGREWVRSQSNGGPYMTKKYMHPKATSGKYSSPAGDFKNPQNFRAYRYGHVLLWRAEIAVEEDDLDYARQLVNQVRNRAKSSEYIKGLVTDYTLDAQPDPADIDWDADAANYVIEPYPANAAAFQSQEEARKAVRLEQRLEFATEGMRFFDLRRWGIADQVLNDFIEEDGQFRSFMRGASYDPEKDDYWPLPQPQLDLQEGVLEQDPAYK